MRCQPVTGRKTHQVTWHNDAYGSDQPVEVVAVIRELRVALFADAYLDYSLGLAEELSRRVDLTLIHPAAWARLAPMDSVAARQISFEQYRIRHPRTMLRSRKLVRSLAELPVDVLHVQATNNPWVNLALNSSDLGVPVVQTVHDVVPHPGDGQTPFLGGWTRRTWRRKVDHFIVHTEGLGGELSRRWGVPDNRWTAVPHGELGSGYRARSKRTGDPVEREPNTVLFFGRVWPYKGLDVLVEALARFPSDRPARLVIAGRGEPIEPFLRDLPPHIDVETFQGFVSHETALELFERATMVCLPYREASQSGVAALAVGLGVPIVASDVGGIGESLRADLDAVLVPPGDSSALASAIIRLLDDSELRDEMSAHQAERAVTDLSWAQITERTVGVYRSILG